MPTHPPLFGLVLVPLVGAAITLLWPARVGGVAARWGPLWTLPGAAWMAAAAGSFVSIGPFADSGARAFLGWSESIPGGGLLRLDAERLVPACLVAFLAPVALALPEPLTHERGRTAWLLVFLAAALLSIFGADRITPALGWLASAWALFFLIGFGDIPSDGRPALGAIALHGVAAWAMLLWALSVGSGAVLVLAGWVRLGAPPFHRPSARIIEGLPTGAILLAGTTFVVTGIGPIARGLASLTLSQSTVASGLFAAGALYCGLVALTQDDVRRRLAGFLATQGAVWAAVLTMGDASFARFVVGRWALIVAAGFGLLVVGYARLWGFTRTADLRAYGGLMRAAPMRSAILSLAVGIMVLLPPVSAAPAWRAAPAELATSGVLAIVAAGWLVAALGLVLAVLRTLRGRAPVPIEAPELRGWEWLWLLGTGAALAAVALLPTSSGAGP